MKFKEDDIVLCKVKKIEGTTVFLEIEGSDVQGSMVLSEVAAGRIRNLRQYVSPNRLIVCKILRKSGDHVEFSLRRVTSREKDVVLDLHKKEKAFRSVLKFVGEDADSVLSKIKVENNLGEFFLAVKEKPSLLEKYISGDKASKVLEVFSEKEGGEKVVERRFTLKSDSAQGIEDIKHILDVEAEVHYLGSSRFSISFKGKDFREANAKMEEVLGEIEKRAKEKNAELDIVKEK
ncbi:MAG: hypothetical protein ABH864_02005 [archaeon]